MKRLFRWVFLLFNAAMVAWLIAYLQKKDTPCSSLSGQACHTLNNIGRGYGSSVIVVVWLAGSVILGLLTLVMPAKQRRECPACGRRVRRGVTDCRSCGFDFYYQQARTAR